MKEAAPVTLADIARLAGVGVGTASRALSNSAGVAPATRKRVLDMAEKFAYVVSPQASSLAKGSTGRVALVVPHLSRWFFAAVTEGLGDVFRDADLDVLLYQVGDAADRRHFFERLPARRKVDAVVVVGFPVEAPEQDRLELMGVQVFAAGGQRDGYPWVGIDDVLAGRQALDHLIFLGHRRIAMLEATDPEQPGFVSGRTLAYQQALAEADIEVHPELVVTSDWGAQEGAQAMSRLLSLKKPPTAVFAHSDEIALGALRTIRRAGLRFPQDISIIGIDDHPLAELTDLSTVAQPAHEQGRRTGELVLAHLRGEKVSRAVQLATELVIRGTTGPPRN